MEFNTHYVLLIKRIFNTTSDMRIPTDTHTRTHCRNPTCPVLHTASFYRSVFLSALNSKSVLCFLVSEKTKYFFFDYRFIFEGIANIERIFVHIYFYYQFKRILAEFFCNRGIMFVGLFPYWSRVMLTWITI